MIFLFVFLSYGYIDIQSTKSRLGILSPFDVFPFQIIDHLLFRLMIDLRLNFNWIFERKERIIRVRVLFENPTARRTDKQVIWSFEYLDENSCPLERRNLCDLHCWCHVRQMTLFKRILSWQAIREPRKFFHFGDVKFDLNWREREKNNFLFHSMSSYL